ncbi:hypothetical protein U6A24_06690 [Aquimarina gracilis]|uniref:Uncharacterized protein n=1 Tax=Aquimarina gracilis TaxID=874422 RepID=A0ABU5ZUA4_9FLAO|nr:hypothetical protein [Aquimarina gracilis]
MQVVTQKSEITEYLNDWISAYQTDGVIACLTELENQILKTIR